MEERAVFVERRAGGIVGGAAVERHLRARQALAPEREIRAIVVPRFAGGRGAANGARKDQLLGSLRHFLQVESVFVSQGFVEDDALESLVVIHPAELIARIE